MAASSVVGHLVCRRILASTLRQDCSIPTTTQPLVSVVSHSTLQLQHSQWGSIRKLCLLQSKRVGLLHDRFSGNTTAPITAATINITSNKITTAKEFTRSISSTDTSTAKRETLAVDKVKPNQVVAAIESAKDPDFIRSDRATQASQLNLSARLTK